MHYMFNELVVTYSFVDIGFIMSVNIISKIKDKRRESH